MPSSLVFAALVVAWLVVLVPMIARRRQAVTRTADRELAARVVRRPSGLRATAAADEEVDEVDTEHDLTRSPVEEREPEPDRRLVPDREPELNREPEPDREPEPASEESERPVAERPRRPYRPGRGGFDPEAAALAARARYALRQRVVLGLLAVAVLSAVGVAVLTPSMWWLHGTVDGLLVSYLVYLRRQVRIEDEVRARRAARVARAQRTEPAIETAERDEDGLEPAAAPAGPAIGRPAATPPPTGTVVVDSDDDPAFHELDDRRPGAYRRAVGE